MTVTPRKRKPVYVGLSITQQAIELAVFSPKSMSIEQVASRPVPDGLFEGDGDILANPPMLKELLGQMLKELKPRPTMVHLSLPGTLLRMVEMPKMEASGLYVSLSSEAERYKIFDNTEAVVDFVPLENANLPPHQQQVVFGAIRNDTLNTYLRILKELRLKVSSISLEPLNVLRAMAGTGVLDSLVQQIGTDSYWGVVFVEPTRVRLSIWQADRLIELRETAMDTLEFSTASPDSIVVEDMLEEIRRTTKSMTPSLWLTHNMPPAMENILASRLGVPFRAAPMGDGLMVDRPLQLSAVGAALSSVVQFPFDFDASVGIGKSGGGTSGASAAAASAVASEGGEGGGTNWLIPAGVVSILLGGVISAGLFVLAAMSGQQIPELESQVVSLQAEVAQLTVREKELQKKVELDQTLIEMIKNARIRNHIYVAMTEDLRNKTPERVWISTLKADSGLQISGRALNHQSVINFARSFDTAPYTQAILINSIKEGRVNGVRIFDFIIGGSVNLNIPNEGAWAELQTIKAPSAPGVEQVKNKG